MAFGERKSVLEWSQDPRCAVKYGVLVSRIHDGWDATEAITSPVEVKSRKYSRPPLIIEAFGETKSANEWKDDPRVLVKPNVFIRRVQHGWTPETAFTTELSIGRGRREGSGPTYEAFDEEKTIREWAQDERCLVSEMTLRKNLQSGMPMNEALQYRRRPGRNLGVPKDDANRTMNEMASVLFMMKDGGELWVYDSGDNRRISLIHNDVRHTIAEETFQEMDELGLFSRVFQTDTVQNFELSPKGREQAKS